MYTDWEPHCRHQLPHFAGMQLNKLTCQQWRGRPSQCDLAFMNNSIVIILVWIEAEWLSWGSITTWRIDSLGRLAAFSSRFPMSHREGFVSGRFPRAATNQYPSALWQPKAATPSNSNKAAQSTTQAVYVELLFISFYCFSGPVCNALWLYCKIRLTALTRSRGPFSHSRPPDKLWPDL